MDERTKPDCERMILLKAQIKRGKTSIICHICYLLNVEGHYYDFGNCPDVDVVRAFGGCVRKDVYDRCRINAKNKQPDPLKGIDAVLDLEPPKFIFIFIKEMLLAGKTLNTEHVIMVIDCPYANNYTSNVDRVVQGLVGRCCGYKKNENVIVVSDIHRVESYLNWVLNDVVPSKPARHTKRDTDGHLVAVASAYMSPIDVDIDDIDEEVKCEVDGDDVYVYEFDSHIEGDDRVGCMLEKKF